MKHWKNLGKRGLALFLVLMMCMTLLPTAALAADEQDHKHNQDGWTCVQGEPERKLTCAHEHSEACYAPGEPVLACEETHHTEDCYAPGEDVLICGFQLEHTHDETCFDEEGAAICGMEEHTHTGECYAPGEDVLTCGEDAHHTEECYVPGEDVLVCTHVHDESCWTENEGEWTCKPPKPVVYATVDEFMDAIAAFGDITDVEENERALDNCDAIYARLSPEDQTAMAEYYEALQAYRVDPNEGIETLAYCNGGLCNLYVGSIHRLGRSSVPPRGQRREGDLHHSRQLHAYQSGPGKHLHDGSSRDNPRKGRG